MRKSFRRAASVTAVSLLTSGLIAALPTTPSATADPGVAGRIVVLDPSHNGANDDTMDNQVPDGRGGTQSCQSTGTVTDGGYPEHTFTWNTVLLIRQQLTQLGVRTAMTRGDDQKVGPCVDRRADIENSFQPDAIVSIAADSGAPADHGFHVDYSSPPLNAAQGDPTVRLATMMRDTLVASGLTPSTAVGTSGLDGRSDMAGLNLAQYPKVVVVLGNMKNPQDAAAMTSPVGRAKYAQAVLQGIVNYLNTPPPPPPPGPAPQPGPAPAAPAPEQPAPAPAAPAPAAPAPEQPAPAAPAPGH